jgi:hypothetical protein
MYNFSNGAKPARSRKADECGVEICCAFFNRKKRVGRRSQNRYDMQIEALLRVFSKGVTMWS